MSYERNYESERLKLHVFLTNGRFLLLQFCCIRNKAMQNELCIRCYNYDWTDNKGEKTKHLIRSECEFFGKNKTSTYWRALDWRVCKIVKKKSVPTKMA